MDRKTRPLLEGPAAEGDPVISPDGRWIAYRSNESGRFEVLVMPFAAGRGKWQVSMGGGEHPRWRADGKELFFWRGTTLMGAEIDGTGPAPRVGNIRELFDVPRRTAGYRGLGTEPYDVTLMGNGFSSMFLKTTRLHRRRSR